MYYGTNKPVMMDADTTTITDWSLIKNGYTVLPTSDARNTADEITNRFFFASNYDFQMGARHSTNVTLSLANKKDNTFYKRNQDNLSASASLTTSYRIPLQTIIAVIISNNATYTALQDTVRGYLPSTQQQTFNYQTISFSARYRLFNERLNLLATVAPSYGDFKRLLLQGGIDYQVIDNHYIVGQVDVIQNPGKGNDVIASVLYRFNF
jgi:hypothetical protein